MKNKKILGFGAEAIIERKNKLAIQKQRISKSYRLPIIDIKLRKIRTRSEAKILQTLQRQGINVPAVICSDDKNMTIDMTFVHGEKIRDVLSQKNMRLICKQIGITLARIHNLNIIHSDLTTSNMILRDEKVVFIDFGLSYFSNRTEDKAVDLHLLKQALDSYHYKISTNAFKTILLAYKKEILDKQVILRLAIVQKRGKNKH